MKINSRNGKSYSVIAVTSCKGGIGKSTVSAGLGEAFSMLGHRVLVIDCDFSNRCLDLCFGCQDRASFGIDDLAASSVSAENCAVEIETEKLYLIPGPKPGAAVFGAEELCRAVEKTAETLSCDTVIIDTPGASEGILGAVSASCDAALIVVSHNPTSVRGAEKTGELLAGFGVRERYLVVNRFDPHAVLRGKRSGIAELIDSTGIPLIGVIPDSPELELSAEHGISISGIKRDRHYAVKAFTELAERLGGERIPLMSYYSERKRRRLVCS
ncbi:MAG: P-loop NTPase [Clostridia bacterium]|nr:P-loop NTPase [Clostridia bacterium]